MANLYSYISGQPFLIAVASGTAAQTLKVITFLILEKRVNFRRFVETDGTPNMHSAAFSALTLCVGFREGFGSVVFALSLSLTAMVSVDIWNVKRAASRHAELIVLILEKLSRTSADFDRRRKVLSYTPVDVIAGILLGCAVAFAFV